MPQHLHLFNFDSFKLIGSPPGRVHRIPGVHCGTERECPRPSGPGLGRVHVCRLDEGTCRRCRAARAQQTVARALLFFCTPASGCSSTSTSFSKLLVTGRTSRNNPTRHVHGRPPPSRGLVNRLGRRSESPTRKLTCQRMCLLEVPVHSEDPSQCRGIQRHLPVPRHLANSKLRRELPLLVVPHVTTRPGILPCRFVLGLAVRVLS